MPFSFIIFVGILALMFLASAIKILPEWERGVVLTLGRFSGLKGPGLILLIPGVQRVIRIDTRVITMDIQPQDVITKDNVTLKVNAVIYFKVVQPEDAVTRVEDFYFATSQLAQTTLRSTLGQYLLDDLLQHRDKINQTLQEVLDTATEPWGIKITIVEVKHIDLPKEMQRAMAREAEAERERRAKVISAEGELQRSERLAQASTKLAESPSALQLAYLQALQEISGEGTSTIVFPLPLDMVQPFLDKLKTDLRVRKGRKCICGWNNKWA
jgi:regulator of protease activity HflC (stomatin/prohibitin superfamily)